SFFLFFFSSRRRHTRSKRDWSSDVCSSDLGALRGSLVVVGSSDFASDPYARYTPENHVFVENAIDWLAQDDALIGIRSKNRAPRSEERRVGKECRTRWGT